MPAASGAILSNSGGINHPIPMTVLRHFGARLHLRARKNKSRKRARKSRSRKRARKSRSRKRARKSRVHRHK